MALNYTFATLSLLCFCFTFSLGALVEQQPLVLKYHNGPLLKGNVTVNIIWYGKFKPAQRSIIVDFIQSLGKSSPEPSVSSWWKTTEKYKGGASTLVLGNQILLEDYPLGKRLSNSQLIELVTKLGNPINSFVNAVDMVMMPLDASVYNFCKSCGSHGVVAGWGGVKKPYIWVENSENKCAGWCAWPFHQPMYGPQTPPLVAPNGDVGVDGMIINLATLLAGTVTNPFFDGYFQGPSTAPLEAVSACTGIFGTGAYPGYPGSVLVDESTGASYNANGINGRKYMLPAMWDPKKLACSTLV